MADEDSDSENEFPDFKPSFVLIAIDTHETMFIKDENGATPFSMALSACYSVADSLILEQNKRNFCQFAIVLAQEDSKSSLLDFQANPLDSIRLLKEKKSASEEQLKELYLRKGPFDLASFFLFCKKKFTAISSKYYQRTMIYVTNDDDPVIADPQKRFTALNEVKSFQLNDISFQIITTKHEFKYNLFYNELFSLLNSPRVDEIAEDEDGLVDKLSSIIITRYSMQRLNFYPFKNDKDKYIPVVKKDYIKSQRILNNAKMSREGNLLKRLVRGGGAPTNRFRLKQFGEIVFDLEEINAMKSSDVEVGLTLIQVSKRLVEPGMVLAKPSLIEFDEKTEENTNECSKFFSMFWQYCYDKEKVLVCARKLKLSDKIRFVELIPKFALNKRMFLMKTIPSPEQIKLPQVHVYCEEYTEAQRKVADALIEKLTFEYDPVMFPDIAFMLRKAYIKSKLLNEPMEKVEDFTQDTEGIDETIGDVAKQFKQLFHLAADTNTKKRKTTATGSRSKKLK